MQYQVWENEKHNIPLQILLELSHHHQHIRNWPENVQPHNVSYHIRNTETMQTT